MTLSRHAWFLLTFAILSNQLIAAELPPNTSSSSGVLSSLPVFRIEIELSPLSIEQLRVNSRGDVRAKIRAMGRLYDEVALHLKGAGTFRSLDDKPSFTLDFEGFKAGQRFQGLRKVHLNNSLEDPSYLKEQLGAELFRAAGIPCPKVSHAVVQLNGRSLGLHVLKEGFTADFLGRHFSRFDGNLYDTDLGHDIDVEMKRHLGSGESQRDLNRLATAALDPDLIRRWDTLEQILDVDRFLSFMAMEIMICHWDGYSLGRNNFRIYHDPETDKIVFLPSGMDQLFAKADMPWKPHMAGVVARAVMEIPEGRRRYESRFKDLLDEVLVADRLSKRVEELMLGLLPFLSLREGEALRREAADLRLKISQRETSLRKQLADPEPVVPRFENNVAPLRGWKRATESGEATLSEASVPGGATVLRIFAASEISASWRNSIRLPRGRYRFQGKAKVIEAMPLRFGRNHGASLRLLGTNSRSRALIETTDWTKLEVEFEVSAPESEVTLICELRVSSGEGLFDTASLMLVQLP